MKTLSILLFGLFFIHSFVGCKPDEQEIIIPIPEYESCCGAELEEHQFITGQYLYVPNAFTPNGDGVNDLWLPYFSSGNENIRAIFIHSMEDDNLIHQIYEFALYPPGTPYGWDGRKSRNGGNLGDNSLHKGGFWYQILFEEPVNFGNGETSFKGKACSIICDEDAHYFRDKTGCFFPVQIDQNRKFDNSKKDGEDDCFGR